MTLRPSVVPLDIQNYIKRKLAALEAKQKVRILIAVESGSRAWGFPSADSDYDVRFIYAQRQDDYLSVRSLRDVIETPLVHDETLGVPMDMNGWDIRKALQLAMKSNPVLNEWLTSPVRYQSTDAAEELLAFVRQAARLGSFEYHYDRLARNAWEQICENPEAVKLKLYCYALRPALALDWIREHKAPPPMDVPSLSAGLKTTLTRELASLIERKAKARESDAIPHNAVLDEFIESALSTRAPGPDEATQDDTILKQANALFRKCLDQ